MLAFESGHDPRVYFVRRIRQQAQTEAFKLTEFEQTYLSRTEQGDYENASKMIETVKGKKFEELDLRIGGLAWRAYQADLALYPDARERYGEALRALANAEGANLNLGMLVNCIALEKSPEELNRTSWASLILPVGVLAWIIFELVRAFLRR